MTSVEKRLLTLPVKGFVTFGPPTEAGSSIESSFSSSCG